MFRPELARRAACSSPRPGRNFSPVSSPSTTNAENTAKPSPESLYERFLEIREDVLRHKWLKSEEAGEDVGFEAALVDWMENELEGEASEK